MTHIMIIVYLKIIIIILITIYFQVKIKKYNNII